MFPDISKLVVTLTKLIDEMEKLNMWMAMLNGFPAQTDPRTLPHEKMKVKYKDVIHPSSIAELIVALNEFTKANKK